MRKFKAWLRADGFLDRHPQLARLLVRDRPGVWVPARRSVARGAGLGALISVLPLPLQALMAALAAIRFNAHLPTAVGMTFLSNPLTTLPLWGCAWMLGRLSLGQPVSWPTGWLDAGPAAALEQAGMSLVLGIPLLGILLGLSCYFLTHASWRFAVVRERRCRIRQRSASF